MDYFEDLKLVRHLYQKFYREGEIIDLKEVVAYLDKHPKRRGSNLHVAMSKANKLSTSVSISEKIIETASKSSKLKN